MLHPDSRQSEGNAWIVAWFAIGGNDRSAPINEKSPPGRRLLSVSALGLVSRFRSSPHLEASVRSELRNQKGH
jgi:hypothetical protein